MDPAPKLLSVPRHYPYAVRMLLELLADDRLSSVRNVMVEPEYGRTARIEYHTGSLRFVFNNDVGLNSAAACDLAKDKAYTKWLLAELGYRVPIGQTFVMPWYQAKIAESLGGRGFSQVRSVSELFSYVNQALFPLYVKPVDGSQGSHIHRCEDPDDIVALVSQYEQDRIRVMLVEQAVTWPDFRLVFLQGELISAYERYPLAVVGDGVRNVDQLLLQMQVKFRSLGRDTKIDVYDPRIDVRLNRLGLDRTHIPTYGMELCLLDISNLSAGGVARDVTSDVAPGWIRLGQSIARQMSLAFCGIDLACANIAQYDDEYAILEVNAAPGLDHYAASGVAQEGIVRALYQRVFDAAPPMPIEVGR